GISEGFLAKFSHTGLLLWATYYGGNDDDYIGGVATDATGNPSIHGWTESYNGIASLGSHKPTKPGVGTYTFLARFNSSGVRQWGTYYNLITTGINNIT